MQQGPDSKLNGFLLGKNYPSCLVCLHAWPTKKSLLYPGLPSPLYMVKASVAEWCNNFRVCNAGPPLKGCKGCNCTLRFLKKTFIAPIIFQNFSYITDRFVSIWKFAPLDLNLLRRPCIHLRKMNMAPFKHYVNEVTLKEQNLPLICCQSLDFWYTSLKGLDISMM